jgi:hypothetical protein
MPSTACSWVSVAMRPCLHIGRVAAAVGDAALQMRGAALRVGVERGGQVVDLALHHRQARGGGGHHAVVQLRHKAQRRFERIGLVTPALRAP